ncbi:hypothetical protein MPSI1_000813 [Malassezia psittaci]|uniref:Enoyl reductase (ER) domain-containing protein n=1 Tax=Malassezia psittaci TaxID=1821823 RepID=A0AAF0F861_9BASI|nr:hypothetical protein MPSI1_000813 [Malassezia psittaci]
MTVPDTMRAVLINGKVGPSDALYIGETQTPRLTEKPNNVLVKIKAFGLNRMDLLQREGKYPVPPGASPILGVEFSGHVAETGSDVKNVQVGEPVFGLSTGGAYAEYISVPSPMVLKKPDAIDWVQAASIPEGSFKKNEDLLVHAGASSVGLAAIQLAKAAGANQIFVTAGSSEKIAFCKKIGATDGFNYKQGNWKEQLMKATDGKGVDLIMDFVGAPYFEDNLSSLKLDGRLTMQGFMGGAKVQDLNIAPILMKRLRIEGSTLRSRSLEYQSKLVEDFFHTGGLDSIVNGVDSKEKGTQLVVHDVFDWNDIAKAHDMMQANKMGAGMTYAVVVTIS